MTPALSLPDWMSYLLWGNKKKKVLLTLIKFNQVMLMFLPQYAVGLHPDPGQLTRRRWGQSWEAFCRCHTTPVDCLHYSLFHPDRLHSPGRHCTPETGWYTDLRGPIRICTSNCSIKRMQVLQALPRLIKLSIIFIICVWIITCIWNYSLKYW